MNKTNFGITFLSKLGNIKPIGFNNLSIKDLFIFFKSSIKNSNYTIKSSAIAFDFFLAIFPAIIFLITLLPIIPIPNFQNILLSEIKVIIPINAYQLFEITLHNLINQKYYGLLSVGIILSIYYSSNALNTLIDILNNSHLIEKEHKTFKKRLLAIALFFKFSILIISIVILSFSAEKIIHFINPNNENTLITFIFIFIKWILTFYFLILAISLIFRYAQSDKLKIKFINAGTLATVIVIILSTLSLSYFFENFSNYNKIYGSIGGLLITLIWIRICCFITVVGFDLYMKVGTNYKGNLN
tara:strand:- start:18898 stop:19797 length:900 start_codon:yes stop_codon:yes gene_type:complete